MEQRTKQYPNPKFNSIEEEEKYWQEHSPLAEEFEGNVQHKRQRRSSYLALRLSGEELKQLRDVAQNAGIGPTTLARNLILYGLKKNKDLLSSTGFLDSAKKLPNNEFHGSIDTNLETDPSLISKGLPMDSETQRTILTVKTNLQKAQINALQGNWQAALELINRAIVTIPEEYSEYIKNETQIIWTTIQYISIRPLLLKAENSINNWDYEGAARALEVILLICEAANRPLDYTDVSIKPLKIAYTMCKSSLRSETSEFKLDRCSAGISVLVSDRNQSVGAKIDGIDFFSKPDWQNNKQIR